MNRRARMAQPATTVRPTGAAVDPGADSRLDLLATAVLLLDERLVVLDCNLAAESLFGLSRRATLGQPLAKLFGELPELDAKLRASLLDMRGFWDPEVLIAHWNGGTLHLNVLATPIEAGEARLALELRQVDQQLRLEREAQLAQQSHANRELIRNLAHEIKNPLGGLRGSAQLLERELERPELREYTQVIIKEADRLQSLLERLLTPTRLPTIDAVNIHEVCERVRTLIIAEFPQGIAIRRDYDASLPEIAGDREQLIQVVLNVVRNAAQALVAHGAQPGTGPATITLATRVARRITIAKTRHKLALELQVLDNGPGIPEPMRERIFFPLVSGREGGTGLGLTLAQTYVQYHRGSIECESRPGRTAFRIVLPMTSHPVDANREPPRGDARIDQVRDTNTR